MITLSVDDQQEVTNLMKRMLTKIDPKGTHMTAIGHRPIAVFLTFYVKICAYKTVNGTKIYGAYSSVHLPLDILYKNVGELCKNYR